MTGGDVRTEAKTNLPPEGSDVEPSARAAVEGDTHGRNKWAILITVLVMTFMSTLDSSIVNVALPVMQKALGVGLDSIQWVASIYLVATCATLLVFGRLGDLAGKVRVFQAGVAVFAAGSLLCGLSGTFVALMASRTLQGIGAAAGMATGMGIITESFPARERGRALGVLASFVALGMMCGPVLGGLIVSTLRWEDIFLINVPVGAISLAVGFKTLPRVRAERRERFDMLGALMLVPGVAITLSCVTLIGDGLSWRLGLALGAGAGLLAGFIVWERRAPQPLAQLSIFRSAQFDLNAMLTLISFVAIGATEIVLPFYLQDARGFDPSTAGLLFAVIPLVNAVVGPLSGAASDRIGAHGPTTAGLAIYAIGIFSVGALTQGSPLSQIVGFIALMSLGTSMFQSPNNSLLMGSAPPDALGFVGSVASLAQNTGMALGISGGMAVLYGQMSARAGRRVTSYLADRPDLFFYGYRWTYTLTAALVALGFALALLRWCMSTREGRRSSDRRSPR
ncbi:MFS transporter [Coriobacterium glomerans]|uniref:MFS transporter n=1 Tax=Coriobacterium glomerans TaxID=33871 RepID=UPI001FE07661|nr:MFS transporter [Coriobacterium glomerans]